MIQLTIREIWFYGTEAERAANAFTDGDRFHATDTGLEYIYIETAWVSSSTPASHTHVEVDITDLDHDALKIQGVDVNAAAPNDGDIFEYDSGAAEWVPVAHVSPPLTVTTITGDTLLDATYRDVIVDTDTAAADVTVTLPTAVSYLGGWTIKNSGILGYNVIIDPNGTETLDNELTETLVGGETVRIVSDNANWWIM